MAFLVLGGLAALLGLGCLLYAFFARREKGPLLINDWILASGSERQKLNKSALYKEAAWVFGALGIIFLLVALGILLKTLWVLWVAAALAGLLAVVVLVRFFRQEAKKDKRGK